jgi:hypothetical protein
MNDVNSLLMATTILAVGGLGLYMYKTDGFNLNEDENDLEMLDNVSDSDTISISESDNSDLEEEEEIVKEKKIKEQKKKQQKIIKEQEKNINY